MATSSVTSGTKADIVMDSTGRPSRERFLSLDVFRGATIAGMILVNDPGDWSSIYAPLRHSRWSGWTPTDLVFPFFLFIVGVSMVFSFSARHMRGESRSRLMGHVLQRGVILFAIGVFINGFPDRYHISTLRIEGVLQRIALCYVISAFIYLFTGRRWQIAAICICLVGYWVLMRFVPVPGFGVPVRDFPLLDPLRNLTAWIDRKLLMGHLYNGINDPEGALSTIPAVASVLFGILTGEWLRSDRTKSRKASMLVVCGIASFIAGEIWNIWFPINKNLWTSSFVLLTTGLALVGLALCYWLLDVLKIRIRLGTFFVVFGVNAIAAYVLSELLAATLPNIPIHTATRTTSLQGWIYHGLFTPLASSINASLLFAIAYVLFCWVVMWLLYRKRIFLKI